MNIDTFRIALVVWITTTGGVHAACNNPTNPLESPNENVTVKFRENSSWGGAFPFELHPEISQDKMRAETPLHKDFRDGPYIDPSQPTKDLPINGLFVVFFEPDGKAGQRICRIENWESRRYATYAKKDRPELRNENPITGEQTSRTDEHLTVPYQPSPLQERSPVLKKLTPDYFLVGATIIDYHTASLPVQISEHTMISGSGGKDTKRRLRACYLYDSKNRLTMYSLAPELAKSCDEVRPGTASILYEYRYDSPNGGLSHAFSYSLTLKRNNGDPLPKPVWSARVDFLTGFSQEVSAGINDKYGVYRISSWPGTKAKGKTVFGRWDDNPVNTIYDPQDRPEWRHERKYLFPQGLPLSVLNDPVSITKHQRVLYTPLSSSDTIGKLVEVFNPGAGNLRDRYYSAPWGIFRHEHYEKGKLKRVINRGYVFDTDDFYKEDIAAHKDYLKVRPNEWRVYEYDDQGKERLVALSWLADKQTLKPLVKNPWEEGGAPTEQENRIAYMNRPSMTHGDIIAAPFKAVGNAITNAAKERWDYATDKKKREEIRQRKAEEAKRAAEPAIIPVMVFGTPDGKINPKWKNYFDFGEAFNYGKSDIPLWIDPDAYWKFED